MSEELARLQIELSRVLLKKQQAVAEVNRLRRDALDLTDKMREAGGYDADLYIDAAYEAADDDYNRLTSRDRD